MSGLGKGFGRSGEVWKHLRIAHTNLLADCYIQKYPDAFKTSAHVGLTPSQWPDYPGEYDSELRYCGVGQDGKEVDGAGVARDVLGWRTRMSVLADRLRDFQPDIIAVTEAQQNQLAALSASLASPQSSSSAPARVITWGPIVPYGRNEEPLLTGLCVGYDAAKVVLVSQEPVMLVNTNTLVAIFRLRVAEGDDAHETDANDTQGTRNSKDVSEVLHVVVHHNTSKKNQANPGDTHFRALVEHLQKAAIDPLVLCGDFNSPTHRSGAHGSNPTPTFIQHGIDTLRLTDPWARGNGRNCETYAPPYLGCWPVRWDYVLVSGLEVVSKWAKTVRPVRNARGKVDGVGTRDRLLATVGSDHAPLGVVVRIVSAREKEERKRVEHEKREKAEAKAAKKETEMEAHQQALRDREALRVSDRGGNDRLGGRGGDHGGERSGFGGRREEREDGGDKWRSSRGDAPRASNRGGDDRMGGRGERSGFGGRAGDRDGGERSGFGGRASDRYGGERSGFDGRAGDRDGGERSGFGGRREEREDGGDKWRSSAAPRVSDRGDARGGDRSDARNSDRGDTQGADRGDARGMDRGDARDGDRGDARGGDRGGDRDGSERMRSGFGGRAGDRGAIGDGGERSGFGGRREGGESGGFGGRAGDRDGSEHMRSGFGGRAGIRDGDCDGGERSGFGVRVGDLRKFLRCGDTMLLDK